jgi:hypothetical protein
MGAGIGVKKYQEFLEAGKRNRKILLQGLQREHGPESSLNWDCLPLELRKINSVVLSHPVCGACYGSPRKLTQGFCVSQGRGYGLQMLINSLGCRKVTKIIGNPLLAFS